MEESRLGDGGKRRAYLIALGLGLIPAVVVLAQSPAGVMRALIIVLVALNLVCLVGLAVRRLPMRWADGLVFSILAAGLLVPLVAWQFDAEVLETDADVLALLLWAALLLPLAFVVFGTRVGVAVSVGTVVVLGALTVPVLLSSPDDPRSPLIIETARHVAFIYPCIIALLWLLSRRLEQLTRSTARADLLAVEATTDVLTGVANRRRLTDELDLLIANARRYQRPLSVALVDIDRFKQVNDTYGHDVGDLVLMDLARRLEAAVRDSDVVGRWGGEEFLVVVPEAGLAEARQLAGRCREQVRQTPVAEGLTVTASFGVATLAEDDDRRTLLRRADLALYTAKHEGRDRVVAINGVNSAAELPAPEHPSR